MDRVLSSSCLSMFEQEAVCMLGGSSIANASASATVAVPVSTYSGHHENSVDNSLYDLQQQILNKQHMIARAQQLIQIQKQEINAFQQAGTSTAILYSIPGKLPYTRWCPLSSVCKYCILLADVLYICSSVCVYVCMYVYMLRVLSPNSIECVWSVQCECSLQCVQSSVCSGQ